MEFYSAACFAFFFPIPFFFGASGAAEPSFFCGIGAFTDSRHATSLA